jgi:type I restriction enzyme, R subunit
MHREGGELERFDRVIANPPFSQNYTRSNMEFPERFRWGWAPTKGKKGDLMFAQHMLAVCKPGGVVTTVMPHGVLFRGGAEKEIRKEFLEQDLIEAVIGLPQNLFYGAGIPACILVMHPNLTGQSPNPNKSAERRGQVLFINADAEFHAGRAQNYLRPEQDIIRHYVGVVLPEGFKAQVVATSRQAAVTYIEKLEQARSNLVAELRALPSATLALADAELEKLDANTRFLVRNHSQLGRLQALEIAAVFSGDHNDPESWWEWADKGKQEEFIKRFKRKFAPTKTDKTDPLSVLVVMNMLLTGFDAPVEQVLYLDRKIVAHDLLQAIARVNRTSGQKKCGYVIDYIGVARHLNEALRDYDGEDIEGAVIDISVELPKLLDRRARAVAIFTSHHVTDLQGEVETCVQLLADLKIRADFVNKLRMFYEMLNILEHRPEVPGDVFHDAKLLGFINKVAANLYRDPALNLFGVAEKVKALINAHISARGVDPKIPPTAITDAEFEKVLLAQSSSRARAAHMQHAARYHIIGFTSQNPAFARKMSEKLEAILQRFKDDWDALERELRKFIDELRRGDRNDFPDLDPDVQVPFVRLVLEECSKNRELTDDQRNKALSTTIDMVERIRQEIRKVGFWKNDAMREILTKALVRDLDGAHICVPGTERDLAQRLVALARENHENLTRR